MSTITLADTDIEAMEDRADELFELLNEMPETAANTHVRGEMRAELEALTETITACRRAVRLQAEIDAAADALLEQAKTRPVAKVRNYRHVVDTPDEGRSFMRAGVDSGMCLWMCLIAVSEPGMPVRYEVADAEGARGVVRFAAKVGAGWEQVDERGCKSAQAVAA